MEPGAPRRSFQQWFASLHRVTGMVMFGIGTAETLVVHSKEPYNAEPKLSRLRASMRTAQADFYVRSHGNIPQIEAARHRLRVKGRVRQELDLGLEDLRQKFPAQTVAAVLQCAGNRRSDMRRVKPVSGDPWEAGAIGNAAVDGRQVGRRVASRWSPNGQTICTSLSIRWMTAMWKAINSSTAFPYR